MEDISVSKVGNMVNKAKPYVLTVGLQFGMAGTYLFTMASLNHGMSRFVFIVYRNAIAALALAPFALIFERCYFLLSSFLCSSMSSKCGVT